MERIEANDPEAQSKNLIDENIETLKDLFPEAITEGKIDFDVLKQLLGGELEDKEEKYGLTWFGKRQARQFALTPSNGTLRPCPEDSLDWNTTQHLMIEGDNLEVLKILQKSYNGKVKLVYVDPPYNTGKDFVYLDNYQNSIKQYLELTGQLESGKKISSNSETSGRFHTEWMKMMYPRLKLTRDFLEDEGVFFISINDVEIANLRLLLNDIYGEENFIACLIWDKGHSAQAGIFKVYHEYVLVYAKNAELIGVPTSDNNENFEAGAVKRESNRHSLQNFDFPAGVRVDAQDGTEFSGKWGGVEEISLISGKFVVENGKTKYPITLRAAFTQKNQMQQFFYGDKENLFDSRGQKIVEFYFSSSGKIKIVKARGVFTPETTLTQYGTQSGASSELADLFGLNETPIDNPKPIKMIQDFAKWFTDDNDIIMDYFAGSGTTAHSVLALNSSDQTISRRRYILVQLPEPINPENNNQKVACKLCDDLGKPRNIAEITKERLRLASKEIKDENPMFAGDTGFRVFKLDSSNIQAWDVDKDNIPGTLEESVKHLKHDRSELDILYELLLKLGLDLCIPIETRTIAGKTVYSTGGGVLMACLATSIKQEEVETLALEIIE